MTEIYDSNGEVVGTEVNGVVTCTDIPEAGALRGWLENGVPGLQGVIDGEVAREVPVTIPPSDELFGLALLEHFENIGWSVK